MSKSEILLSERWSDKPRDSSYRVLMVTGVYPTQEKPHAGTFIKSQVESLKKAGVTVEVLHPGPGPVPLRYAKATLQVFLKAMTGRFDIIHGHFGLWCLAARMQWTTPVVASFLGDDLLGKPSAKGGFTRKSKLVISVSRWLCSRVDAVIVKSEEMKKVAFTPNVSIYVIPNGVDFDLFHPIHRTEARAALRLDQNRCFVLFGNDPTIPRKNYALAQAAVEYLQKKGIDVQLIVNNGLPQEEVVLYMNACNALLLTSILEGSPNIVKEAMACNVPIVSTNVGDVMQIIGETQGCSVCSNQPDRLAAELEKAIHYPQRTTGRVDIAHLEVSIVAQKVISLYEQVLMKKSKRK